VHCQWCESQNIEEIHDTVYWELPDGSRAIEITGVPSISCKACGMVYLEEIIVEEIEDQLFLIDTKTLPKRIDYDTLMKLERLLKKNYFKQK